MAVAVSLATRYLDCVEYELSLTSIDEQLFLAYSNEKMTRGSDTERDDKDVDMDDGESIASAASSSGADAGMEDTRDDCGERRMDPFAVLPQECCSTILLMLNERDLVAAAR